MVKEDESALEARIGQFMAEYASDLNSLISGLDEARISHYSSGCGTKRITFDIFPASACVRDMLGMLSLNRPLRTGLSGLRDINKKTGYNPGQDFILYLRRWAGFAEQVMRHEGASARGVAAARAKLLIDDLSARLIRPETAGGKRPQLMMLAEDVGAALHARQAREDDHRKAATRENGKHNYLKALAAAQRNTQAA